MGGYRYFECSCGKKWLEHSRDKNTPSGDECECGEWVFAKAATNKQIKKLTKKGLIHVNSYSG